MQNPDTVVPRTIVVPLVWFGVLLGFCYAPVLASLAWTWRNSSAEMGHGFLAPLVAAYMVWLKQGRLRSLSVAPHRWGMVLMVLGAVQLIVGTAAKWAFASQTALLVSLCGCLLYLCGPHILRELAYPLFTLALMVPPAAFLYSRFTLQLQLAASRLGEIGFELLGYSVLREGNILELTSERLFVAEACSGIRSMIVLFFFFVVYGYFLVPQVRIRWILLAATVPLAILGNTVRIILTGVVASYSRELAHGLLHETAGYVVLVSAALVGVGLHQLCARRWRQTA